MKILCFGDSNTFGYDPRSFFGGQYPAEHRWVDLLAGKLGCEAVNAGENGREIPRGNGQLEAFDRLLEKAHPVDLLAIMLGTNDLLQGNSVEAVAGRMETFLKHIPPEKIRILLISPPPMKLGEWVPSQALVEDSGALCREYKALAWRLDVDFADTASWNVPLTFDGVHFTEEGHHVFAKELANHINKGE